jgi:penicillin-binding protein 1A
MRQPGSSFKPYVYTTALLNGFKPTSIVVDGPVCIGNWCPQNFGHSYSGAITLTKAITHSINVIPVKLSIMLGNGNPKLGRQKIVEVARKFGIVTPLPDTPSLPIGADEVNVLEHTVAYAAFPNGGMAVTPHAVLEVRSATGETIWRFDRDGPKPRRIIPQSVASDMAFMMNKVVEEGTARRAQLAGIKAGGKTGTTNAYRDAWFVGYTGNYVCGVWYGNDDYQPLNRMTGGALPAMTWHAVMAYAHQGIELKNLIGNPPNPAPFAPPDPTAASAAGVGENLPRPTLLTARGAQTLQQIERFMEDTSRTIPPTTDIAPERTSRDRTTQYAPGASASPTPNALATAEGNPRADAVRGN